MKYTPPGKAPGIQRNTGGIVLGRGFEPHGRHTNRHAPRRPDAAERQTQEAALDGHPELSLSYRCHEGELGSSPGHAVEHVGWVLLVPVQPLEWFTEPPRPLRERFLPPLIPLDACPCSALHGRMPTTANDATTTRTRPAAKPLPRPPPEPTCRVAQAESRSK